MILAVEGLKLHWNITSYPEKKGLIGQLLMNIKRGVIIVRSSLDFFSRMCLKATCGIPAHTTEMLSF